MKNIHLLPTDKLSRLMIDTIENKLYLQPILHEKTINVLTQNIYITSDEEIKEGDYWIYICPINGLDYGDNNNPIVKNNLPPTWFEKLHDKKNYKKIILTTDQDLIADGVQAIDDEFLEWFVKNASCEFVEVKKGFEDGTAWGYNFLDYKIIIPQEESKQETRVFGTEDDKSFWSDKPKQKCEHIKEYGCIKDICTCNTGPKQDPTLENAKLALREYILANKEKVTEDLQEMREKSGTGRDETLEEAADNYSENWEEITGLDYEDCVPFSINKLDFIAGAKWQSERMYSEEDLRKAYFSGISSTGEGWNGEYADGNDPNIEEKFSEEFTQWFEQFKKK
jgi:hypothetical protein